MLSFYILNVILHFFTILNCDCKFEFKIFYVLHVPLEAKKILFTYTENSIIS